MVEDALGGVSPEADEDVVVGSVGGNSGDVVVSTDLIISPTASKFTEVGFYPFFGVEVFIEEMVFGHCAIFG